MGRIITRPEISGGFTTAGIEIVDASGNIKAPVSTTNLTTTGTTTIGDSTSDTLTVNSKMLGQLYWNQTSATDTKLKVHNHLTTASIGGEEIKTETVATSGAFYGLYNEAHISATGTTSVTGVLSAAVVASTFTVTGGTIIGTYGQARADGTVAGSSMMAGLYGLIEASSAITASHVCSAWLDSHQANAVTGSHELLYMSNNGAATMDQAIYVYGGDKITNLMELNTVSGMVSATAETGGSSKKIKITIDGVTHYINAYTG
jgi:hypothetical protein